ncbi:MAG: M24 family metallopeptidase [Angelakisella sp.]
MRKVLSLKQQAELFDHTLRQRLDDLLPTLMKRENVSMWIVMNREYNEDPVYLSLVPRMVRSARRLSCLIFHLNLNGTVSRYCIGNDRDFNDCYTVIPWNPMTQDRMELLRDLIEHLNPKNIALNYSETNQFADGLTKSLYDTFRAAMSEDIMSRVISAEHIVTAWLETRNRQELARYKAVNALAKEIIETAFSSQVITPGITTTTDVEWFLMEAISEQGLVCWFTPTVDLQRKGNPGGRISDEIIIPGDVLHCDFGLEYMGLCTDTQRIFYVPRQGETAPPDYLQRAYEKTLRFMDIVAENCVAGHTGNQILLGSVAQAEGEGLKPHLYTHPIGVHGHAAGPTIGLYYKAGAVPGAGEYPLYPNTCYALELNTKVTVPEWNNEELWVMREETVCFKEDHQLEYLMEEHDVFKLVL